MQNFTIEQKRAARKSDLYSYLRAHHGSDVKLEGTALYLRNNNSVYVKQGYSGYRDFSTGEHGNPIDFLVTYLGYSIVDAVIALSDGKYTAPKPLPVLPVNTEFPEPAKGEFKQTFAYLKRRGIPYEITRQLIDSGILYQTDKYNNMVFINKEKDFAELHGTLTYGKAFHSVIKSSPDRFWWFGRGKKVYVCESAIDAISLYLLRNGEEAIYVSIAGVDNQKSIDRIKNQYETILAVDNDNAGDIRSRENPELMRIVPTAKDWNEDLQRSITPTHKGSRLVKASPID